VKIGHVCPDDLSTVIFVKSFAKRFASQNSCKTYTISPVVQGYLDEIDRFGAIHIPIKMDRYLNPLSDFRYIVELYKICRHEKFDVVINWTTKPNVYGAISEKLAGTPIIVCAVRGLGGAFLKQKSAKGKLVQQIISLLYRISFKISTKIWFTNPKDLDFFLQKQIVDSQKAILTKNALNVRDYSMESVDDEKMKRLRKEIGLSEDEYAVVMVARLIWSKGIKEFIESAEHLYERQPNIRFILVAPPEDGRQDAVPVSYIKEKEKNKNFLWLGFRNDVKEIYAISDIAVLPSFYKEGGYPRALLEPMAFAKPVITTDIPECRGAVEHGKNGYLIPPRDGDALADSIERLIRNPERRKQFGRYSRHKVEKEFNDIAVIDLVLHEIGIDG